MAGSDGQVVCSTLRWSPGGRPLGEVVRAGLPLPGVLKIVRGSCGGLGVPSLPHPTLQPTVMLVSAGRRRQIVAQAVKLRPGRGPVAVGPRITIPETYAGWFELLSEEGRAGRCVESVAELSRRPCPCLVREPLRAILAKPSLDSNSPGPVVADGSRTLAVGETISPGEEVSLAGGSNPSHPRGRYLTCSTGRGDSVLLSLEQRGRFSPLAKEHNISGAHSARTLLAKRLPLTVRLLHGVPPRGLKHFTPELRLLAAFEEEQVFAYPLQKETASLVALPLSAPLKVLRARNEESVYAMQEFTRLADKCTRLLGEVSDRMHVLDAKVGDRDRDSKTWRGMGMPFLRRSASTESANAHPGSGSGSPHQPHHQDENRAPLTTAASSPRLSATPDEYDEIDQIYDYVRGFAPLPKSFSVGSAAVRSATPPTSPLTTPSVPPSPTKPEPPPIETIPTKKLLAQQQQQTVQQQQPQPKAEKRSRHKEKEERTSTRLYTKNGQSQGHHGQGQGHGHLQGHGQQGHVPRARGHSRGPPLINSMRYKSLSNIHGAMELDAAAASTGAAAAAAGGAGAGVGTLDSSHSGGRTSGDSGPGNKLPEKRSRKLSRPRSLTNLVWEVQMRGSTAPPIKLEPGVHQASHPHRHRLSIAGHKRLGTLYL